MSDNPAHVRKLPNCDLCRGPNPRPAKYNGRTILGPWAYMCQTCFTRYGTGLGLGVGQVLEEER